MRVKRVPPPTRDVRWMQHALAQARYASTLGEIPIGAVAVYQEQIIGVGFNRKECEQNPLAHAEMFALRQAAEYLGNWRLAGVTLYCTL